MTPEEHKDRADELLSFADKAPDSGDAAAHAQAHASLASAGYLARIVEALSSAELRFVDDGNNGLAKIVRRQNRGEGGRGD